MLDPILRPFIHAADTAAADGELSSLLETVAAPLVHRIAAAKLHAGARGTSAAEDADDVASDALLSLVSKLQSLRANPESAVIESFERYVATVTLHAFAHYLRRRHPERARMKDRLRYALTRERGLGLWSTLAGLACGLSAWRPAPPSAQAAAQLDTLCGDTGRWHRWAEQAKGGPRALKAALREVLVAAGGPLEFDHVVGAFAPRQATVSLSDATAQARTDGTGAEPEAALDRQRTMASLWREVGALPVKQRVALLLSLRDANGAGLLWVWPVAGIATLRQIAAVLEVPAEELAALWPRLPLPDQDIAGRLDCTRQQVINLRSAARKRLAYRLGADEMRDPEPRGNTRAFPASWKDEA